MGKRSPITDLAGHLMWTRGGTCYATWRIRPLTYNLPLEEKETVARLHAMLFRGLAGESLLTSAIVSDSPTAVIARMIDGIDLAQAPGWAGEVDATWERLEELPIGERFFWLTVPLGNVGRQRWSAASAAAWRQLMEALDVPLTRPVTAQMAARAAQAEQIQAVIPAPFEPTPVTVAEQLWLQNHGCRRGMVDLPVPEAGGLGETLMSPGGISAAGIVEPVMDPGARTDEDPPARTDLAASRVLKVIDPRGADLWELPASYQCVMALAQTPAGGLAFPGSEVFAALDRCGMDVDWAMHLRVTGRDAVITRNRRAAKMLNEQYGQRSREAGTGLHDLSIAAELLTEYDARFAADKELVEVEHSILLAVGAARFDPGHSDAQVRGSAIAQAQALERFMAAECGMGFERPAGRMSSLWQAMLPGSPRPSLLQTYRQYATSDDVACLVPLSTTRLGGRRGPVLALEESRTRPAAVHIGVGSYAELDISDSFLAIGELGAGKSVAQKTIASHVVDQGGQVFAIDKSADGEWVKFGCSFARHTIIDLLEPACSMDPLRALPLVDGLPIARTFLVTLLNVDAQDQIGRLIARTVSVDYLHREGLAGLGQWAEHIAGGACSDPAAADLGERLATWIEDPLARVVFDASLPPADLQADITVWRTHGTGQPTDRELSIPHLFRSLPLAKIFGRAYYRMLIASGKHLAFSDRARPVLFNIDELYDAMRNPENVTDIQDFVRQGRRARAVFGAGTHDASDPGDDVIVGLIPTRLVFRQRDETLARRALQWLGIAPTDPDFEERLDRLRTDLAPLVGDAGVPEHRRGECMIRDAYGQFSANCRILPPAQPARRAAALSTPPAASVRLAGEQYR